MYKLRRNMISHLILVDCSETVLLGVCIVMLTIDNAMQALA
jgi:hypothetical protein